MKTIDRLATEKKLLLNSSIQNLSLEISSLNDKYVCANEAEAAGLKTTILKANDKISELLARIESSSKSLPKFMD